MCPTWWSHLSNHRLIWKVTKWITKRATNYLPPHPRFFDYLNVSLEWERRYWRNFTKKEVINTCIIIIKNLSEESLLSEKLRQYEKSSLNNFELFGWVYIRRRGHISRLIIRGWDPSVVGKGGNIKCIWLSNWVIITNHRVTETVLSTSFLCVWRESGMFMLCSCMVPVILLKLLCCEF